MAGSGTCATETSSSAIPNPELVSAENFQCCSGKVHKVVREDHIVHVARCRCVVADILVQQEIRTRDKDIHRPQDWATVTRVISIGKREIIGDERRGGEGLGDHP